MLFLPVHAIIKGYICIYMQSKTKNIFKKIAFSLLFAGILCIPNFVMAASDPGVKKLTITPDKPGPGESTTFVATYANEGNAKSGKVELTIDYNENIFEKISLNDSKNCIDTKFTVYCTFDKLPANYTNTISFKASVKSAVIVGTKSLAIARIDDVNNPNDNIKNNSASATTTIAPMSSGKISQAGLPAALGLTKSVKLEKPSKNQGVAVFDVTNNKNWKTSGLFTTGLKFMIRGKEALAWTLGISDGGFHNPAIKSSYLKVLTIVNSLFIIGLLAIAGMWMFSILIPRAYLKRVVLIYGMAVIFVNFALPMNQLLIDTTNLLQKTFMDGVKITNIVEIPSYNDKKAVGYQNETGFLKKADTSKLTFNLSDPKVAASSTSTKSTVAGAGAKTKTTTPTITVKPTSISVGKITQDPSKTSFIGNIKSSKTAETISLSTYGNDPEIKLNASQNVELINSNKFNPDQEHSIFAFVMMILTSLAYFGMALVLILRIVILWALMIVSPALFLLIIFRATRSYFVNWLGLYARWLLIGPLMALGIAVVVNIWKTTGLPITSSYSGGQFGVFTNIGFFLPGKDTANTLSTTGQMMEYILFLIMLYLPIIFAFMLTRQKTWAGALSTIINKKGAVQKPMEDPMGGSNGRIQSGQEGKEESKATSFTQDIKGFLNDKFTKTTATAIPGNMRGGDVTSGTIATGESKPKIENAGHFLPENLEKSDMKSMVNLASGDKGSRNSHQKAIEKLAKPQSIIDPQERKKVSAVKEEIGKRAEQGDVEAIRVMGEISQAEQSPVGGSNRESVGDPVGVSTEIVKEKEIIKEEKPEKDTAQTSGGAVGDAHVRPDDMKKINKPNDDEDSDEDAVDPQHDADTDKEDEDESDEIKEERKSRRK